ncbi:hypothetical protein SmJEL517_g06132, partial [Synchytrium microbalum]
MDSDDGSDDFQDALSEPDDSEFYSPVAELPPTRPWSEVSTKLNGNNHISNETTPNVADQSTRGPDRNAQTSSYSKKPVNDTHKPATSHNISSSLSQHLQAAPRVTAPLKLESLDHRSSAERLAPYANGSETSNHVESKRQQKRPIRPHNDDSILGGLSIRQATSHGRGAIVDEDGHVRYQSSPKTTSVIKSQADADSSVTNKGMDIRQYDPLSAQVFERVGSKSSMSPPSDGESSDDNMTTPKRGSIPDDASLHSGSSTSNVTSSTTNANSSTLAEGVASRTRNMFGRLKQRASAIFKDPPTSSNTNNVSASHNNNTHNSRSSTATPSTPPLQTEATIVNDHGDDGDAASIASSDVSGLTNMGSTNSFAKAHATGGRYLKVRSNMKKTKELNRLVFVQEMGAPLPGIPMVSVSGANVVSSGDSSFSGIHRGARSAPSTSTAAASVTSREGSFKEPSISNKSSSAHTAAMGGDASDGSAYMNGISGAIWAMRVSEDGRFLAAAGQDCGVRIWCLSGDPKHDVMIPAPTEPNTPSSPLRMKSSNSSVISDDGGAGMRKGSAVRTPVSADVDDLLSPTLRVLHNDSRQESRNSVNRAPSSIRPSGSVTSETWSNAEGGKQPRMEPVLEDLSSPGLPPLLPKRPTPQSMASINSFASTAPPPIFQSRPLRVYRGHASDVLDVCWSKNGFLLSSSMDRTVRLWHVSRSDCLCCFQHTDFVTSIRFHPTDDRYFASGSLDGRIRIWSIPEKKVERWNELPGSGFVTAVAFSHDGKYVAAGTYAGDLHLFEFNGLVYRTQVQVKSTRGRNQGRKITGIEPLPPSRSITTPEDLFLVTSNDSRVRLYNIRDMSLRRKFRGPENRNCQIRAAFSDDATFITCGSEDKCAYIWRTEPPPDAGRQMSGVLSGMLHWQLDREFRAAEAYEKFVASDDIVTCCIFVPSKMRHLIEEYGRRKRTHHNVQGETHPGDSIPVEDSYQDQRSNEAEGLILICADRAGRIRVFENEAFDAPSSYPILWDAIHASSAAAAASLSTSTIAGGKALERTASIPVRPTSRPLYGAPSPRGSVSYLTPASQTMYGAGVSNSSSNVSLSLSARSGDRLHKDDDPVRRASASLPRNALTSPINGTTSSNSSNNVDR